MEDNQIIGLGALGIGSFLFLLGVLLGLDRGLLTISNLLILLGIVMLMSLKRLYEFLIQKQRAHGSIAFFLGIVLVLCKLPFPGVICEVTGAYWLFGGFWPMLLNLLMRIPNIETILSFVTNNRGALLPM